MKISMTKLPGGGLIPSTDLDAEKMIKFKSHCDYEIEIKLPRNPQFLKKVMVFFHFCYDHWDGDKVAEHCTPQAQFDRFRRDLTILSGYYIQTVRLDGSIRTEAQSLAFANMTEEIFSDCYQALIKASIKHIFQDADENTINQLYSFF